MPVKSSPKFVPLRSTSQEKFQDDDPELSDELAEFEGEELAHARALVAEGSESSESSGQDTQSTLKNAEGPSMEKIDFPPWNYQPPETRSATKKSFWHDLDLSIIVAIVSPIGNWLTGGDYVKNILIIILLIFYLHQVIESMYPFSVMRGEIIE